MKNTERSQAIIILTSLSLMILLAIGPVLTGIARADSSSRQSDLTSGKTTVDKISSEVRKQKQGKHDDGDTVKVILQLKEKPRGPLNAFLNRHGIHVRKEFQNFNSMMVELPADDVEELASYSEVQYISLDSNVQVLGGLLSTTTGTDAARLLYNFSGSFNSLDGTGIAIAFVDSGIDPYHIAFTDEVGTRSRIIINRDFTGEGRTDDPYGHGTHVASLAAGNGRVSKGKYLGIAPNAYIVNLRVLNSKGIGTVSSVLGALDWLMSNSATYNIRVANLSLGMPAIDSYRNDPICRAVRRLVDAGMVVVAASGNNGKDAKDNKVYGQVHSPGIEPSAITVGASNANGTIDRADDTITTYSSRGPTRGFWTDMAGLKHYDNVIKPDLVAPGNKVVGAEAPNNYLVAQNPSLDVGGSGDHKRKMMRLSGTSMATPVVSGAAALLFQAQPKLTPNMIKMILMYTAQQLPDFNMFEQGAGEINVEGAVRLARAVRPDLGASAQVGTPLLITQAPPTPQTSLPYQSNGYNYITSFSWSQGIILNYTYATGTNLITNYQGIYGLGVLLGDGVLVSDGVLISDAGLMGDGVILGDNILTSTGTTMAAGTRFTSTGVLLGDGVILSDGVILGDGVILSDSIITGSNSLSGNALIQARSILNNGDPIKDVGLDLLDQ